jgi:uncharacterized protein YndB with AHSA1/START domain
MTTSINHKFFFPHPASAVWEYLTIPELLEKWLMKNDFKPAVGHEFQFRTNPIPKLNFDGICYCVVLEIVPLKKLSYSWKGGPGDGEITLDTIVAWTLESDDKGTTLYLTHSGFSETKNFDFYTGMTEGWLKNLNKIAERLNAVKHDTNNA